MEVMDTCVEERQRMKMRIAVLQENVQSCELECKAGRETVVRLMGELERERRKALSSAAALDSVKVEFDGLVVGRRSVELEKETLTERLEASRRVIDAAQRESSCLETQLEELERKLRRSEGETRAAEKKLQTLLEKAAGVLQERSQHVVRPTEEEVIHSMEKLCNEHLSEMDVRLCLVSEELSRQTELRHSATQRAQVAEQEVQELREQVEGLQSQLLAADVHHESLRHGRQEYEDFLDQLSEAMKVDSVAVDLGCDMRLKLLLSRVDQLVKREAADLVESKTLSYSLQRKLKSQKDQLESRGLHVQLLRKKVSELEEEKRSRSAAERDVEVRRLQKRLERLQGELRNSKLSNAELKAQLSHSNELKLKVTEESQSMKQENQKRLVQLLEGKTKTEKKLSTARADLQSREEKSREDQQQLQTLRRSLDQLSEREQELEDFRMVVSQMMGLDVTTLDHPNYDIIKLLETHLHPHHHHHHHLLHHVNAPWVCPTHQGPRLHLIQDLQTSDASSYSCRRSPPPGLDLYQRDLSSESEK